MRVGAFGSSVLAAPTRVDWRFQDGFRVSVVREPGRVSAQLSGDLDALSAKILRRDHPIPIEPARRWCSTYPIPARSRDTGLR